MSLRLITIICMFFVISMLLGHPVSAEINNLIKPQQSILQDLSKQSEGTMQITWNEKTKTPSFIGGCLSSPSRRSPETIAFSFLQKVKGLFGFGNPEENFQIMKVEHDQFDMTHIRLQRMFHKIPVFGDELIIHIDKQGIVRAINGRIYPHLEKRISGEKYKPILSPQQAIDTAKKSVLIQGSFTQIPKTQLFFLPDRKDPPLVFIVTLRFSGPNPGSWYVFVDAHSGDVVDKFNALPTKRAVMGSHSLQ